MAGGAVGDRRRWSTAPTRIPDPDTDDEVIWPYELYQLAISYHNAPVPGLAHAEIGRFDDP